MLFALFLNKGKLTITAKAPYLLDIGGFKSVSCTTDLCSVEVAPGKYDIKAQKADYQDVDLQVSVPIGGEAAEQIEFKIIPTLTALGDESSLNLFAMPKAEAEDLPKTGLFYETNYVLYLERDQQTHRQTLYYRSIENGLAGAKTVAASFMRDLKNPLIASSIEKNNKIAVIDAADTGSTLYMIDLKEKTRTNLFSYPIIKDVKWLPGSDDFLFEAKDSADITDSIFLYSFAQQKAQKLDLKTPLADVVPVTKDRLIAATIQQTGADSDLSGQEGQLVTLGESETSPNVAGIISITTAPVLKFVDYSLISGQSRLLKSAPDLNLPQKGKISDTGKSAYYMIDGKDFELLFSD
jgi:hypothetical protein